MKIAIAVGASVAALALTSCAPPHVRHGPWWSEPLKPVSSLDCPSSQGELTLKSTATDRKSCVYAGDGAEVELALLPLSGDPDSVLGPIETRLKTLLPAPPTPAASSAPAAPPASDGHDVNIRLPGLSIHAADERADIRVAGLHIDADGTSDSVHMTHGAQLAGRSGFTIDANDQGAIIRTQGRGPDVRQTLILASDKPGPDGWRLVGYDAHGPRSGPLVVATVKSRSDEVDRAMNDAKRLVERSARG